MKLAIIPIILTGCIGPGSAQDLYLALHGQWTVDPDTLCDSLACGLDEVDEIREVLPEVSGVVEVVEVGPTTFTLEGVAQGDTLVTISGIDRGSDIVERYAEVIVRPVSQFAFGLRCDTMDYGEDPWVLPTGAEVFAQWSSWDTDYNDLWAFPEFEAQGVEQSALDAEDRNVTLTMPDEAGEIALTSPIFDGTVATFLVHEDGAHEAFEADFWPETPLEIGSSKRVETALLVQGHRACIDQVERTATISTPETCSFATDYSLSEVDEQDSSVLVYGLAEGECGLEVSVPSYGWSEQLTVDVIPEQEEDTGA